MKLEVQITSTRTLQPGENVLVCHETTKNTESPRTLTITGKKKIKITTSSIIFREIYKRGKPETEMEIVGWEIDTEENKKPVTVVLS